MKKNRSKRINVILLCLGLIGAILAIWTLWGNMALMVSEITIISDRLPSEFLSGYAHGGQIRLPFVGGLIALDQGLFAEYDAGLYIEGNTSMIVSRGLGNSVILFRFNNRLEIILFELQVGNAV